MAWSKLQERQGYQKTQTSDVSVDSTRQIRRSDSVRICTRLVFRFLLSTWSRALPFVFEHLVRDPGLIFGHDHCGAGLEAKAQSKLRRLTQRLLNIGHGLDRVSPKMSACWPVNERVNASLSLLLTHLCDVRQRAGRQARDTMPQEQSPVAQRMWRARRFAGRPFDAKLYHIRAARFA